MTDHTRNIHDAFHSICSGYVPKVPCHGCQVEGDPDPLLEGIAHIKLRQFAAKAAVTEVSDLLNIAQLGRRQTLLLTLLRQARMRCQDELVEMMLRRMRRTQALARGTA